jgi:hypothetical protein
MMKKLATLPGLAHALRNRLIFVPWALTCNRGGDEVKTSAMNALPS